LLTSLLATDRAVAGGEIPQFHALSDFLAALVFSPQPECIPILDMQSEGGLGWTHSFTTASHGRCGGSLLVENTADLIDDIVRMTASGQLGPNGVALTVLSHSAWGDTIYFDGLTQPETVHLTVQYLATKTGSADGELVVLAGDTAVRIPLTDTAGEYVFHEFAFVVTPSNPTAYLTVEARLFLGPDSDGDGSWEVRMVGMRYHKGLTCRGAHPAGWIQQTCSL
jgi:hypothetical protein